MVREEAICSYYKLMRNKKSSAKKSHVILCYSYALANELATIRLFASLAQRRADHEL